jgi:hypothetical protein
MDEIAKIYLKSGALIKARDYLLNQAPSDVVSIAAITENIVDLTGCRLAAAGIKQIPQLSEDEQLKLRHAIVALDTSIEAKASSSEILIHAKGVFDFVPWPPKGVKLTLPDLENWPGQFDDIARWPP